jgi:FkbM family methyltransferase
MLILKRGLKAVLPRSVRRRIQIVRANRGKIRSALDGLSVVLVGNRVRLQGLTFAVGAPGIPLWCKGWLRQGTYEAPEIRAVRQYLDPNLPVIELGGFLGVVACVTNRLLEAPDQHLVVEPNPQVIDTLKRNRDRNGCCFTVVEAAVAYADARLRIMELGSFLSDDPARAVPVARTTLAALIEQLGRQPVCLICDIEGAETELVAREGAALQQAVKVLLLETHPWRSGMDGIEAMFATLAQLGFEQVSAEENVYVFRNTTFAGA